MFCFCVPVKKKKNGFEELTRKVTRINSAQVKTKNTKPLHSPSLSFTSVTAATSCVAASIFSSALADASCWLTLASGGKTPRSSRYISTSWCPADVVQTDPDVVSFSV